MRVVADTNLIVSAMLINNSVSFRCFAHILRNHTPLSSAPVIDELIDVIKRPRFDKYVLLTKREEFVRSYWEHVEIVTTVTRLTICRDPDDNRLLEIAADGQADVLVTGDQDLLVLADQFPFVICRPDVYLERFASS